MTKPWGNGPAPRFEPREEDADAWTHVKTFTGEGPKESYLDWRKEVDVALSLDGLHGFVSMAYRRPPNQNDPEEMAWYQERARYIFAKVYFCTDDLARDIVSQHLGDGPAALLALHNKYHRPALLFTWMGLVNYRMRGDEDPEHLYLQTFNLMRDISATFPDPEDFKDFFATGVTLARMPAKVEERNRLFVDRLWERALDGREASSRSVSGNRPTSR